MSIASLMFLTLDNKNVMSYNLNMRRIKIEGKEQETPFSTFKNLIEEKDRILHQARVIEERAHSIISQAQEHCSHPIEFQVKNLLFTQCSYCGAEFNYPHSNAYTPVRPYWMRT